MSKKLSNLIRQEVNYVLEKEGIDISNISNYNISRAALSGIFTIIFYKRKKTQKGDKKSIKLELDNQISTLVVALEVIDAMIKEATNNSFISKKLSEQKEEIIPEDSPWGKGDKK
jgi:predicted amino acid-binding ACT domain protein